MSASASSGAGLDRAAEVGEGVGRGAHGPGDRRVEGAEFGTGEHADPQSGHRRCRVEPDGPQVGVAAVRSGQAPQRGGEVADAARHRPDMPVAQRHPRPVAGDRDAAPGRLERRDPGVVGRSSYRDRDVAAESQRRHPRGDGRGLATTGPARGALGIPRVQRSPGDEIVGLCPVGEFGEIRLPQHDAARRAQPRHRRGVRVRDPVGEQTRTAGSAHPGDIEGVLDRDRHTVERTEARTGGDGRVRAGGLFEGLVGRDGHEGIDAAVDLRDPIQVGLYEFGRGARAPRHQLGHGRGVQRRQVDIRHRAGLFSLSHFS